MTNFVTLDKFPNSTIGSVDDESDLYWKKFNTAFSLKRDEQINNLEFVNSKNDSTLVVSAGCDVILRKDGILDKELLISKFTREIRTSTLRKDSKLLAASGDEQNVKLIDPQNKQLLRKLEGHSDIVKKISFDSESLTNIASFSNDGNFWFWDIPRNKKIVKIKAHENGISDGFQCYENKHNWFTAGKSDSLIRGWDLRAPENFISFKTFFKIQKILLLPLSDSIIFGCGEKTLSVFDNRMNGKLLNRIDKNSKLVCGLGYDPYINQIITCSLDRSVKMFDVQNFKMTFCKWMDFPVSAIAVHEKKLAIGCTNGLVTVLKSKKEKIQKKRKIIVDENVKTTILEKPKFRKLAKYDKDLKFFRYKEAVDNLIIKNNPSAAMASSLFRELIERNALKLALSNRKDENLAKILKFLIKNLFRPQFSVVFLNVAWQILEIYSEQVFLFSESKWLFKQMKEKIDKELKLEKKMLKIEGILDSVCC